MDGAEEAAGGGQVRRDGRQGQLAVLVAAGGVGELDRDGLGGVLGDRAVELLDGALGLAPLVKSDETYTFGKP